MEKKDVIEVGCDLCEKSTQPEADVSGRSRIKNFVRELEKVLYGQLRTRCECVPSRRIEGQLTRKTVMMPFNQVVIMVDADIDNINYEFIVTGLCKFVKNDRYFKFTRYNIVLWMNNEFLLHMPKKVSARQLKQNVDEFMVGKNSNNNWTQFRTLYRPYKKEQMVILITTEHKINNLKQDNTGIAKNLLIIYQNTTPRVMAYSIHGTTCLGFSNATNLFDSMNKSTL